MRLSLKISFSFGAISGVIFFIMLSSLNTSSTETLSLLSPYFLTYGMPLENLSVQKLLSQGSPYLGNTSAPLTLIDFSDFQCYLCKRYVDNTEQQINDTYIQRDKILYIFKHLPNRGLNSFNASLAAQCTNDEGQFWKYHKTLYENQGGIDTGWVSNEKLKEFASTLDGINMTDFDSCVDTKKYESLVKDDIRLGNSLGFMETPSFALINNNDQSVKKIQGPKPFPIFQIYIEDMLAKSKQ